MGFEELRGTPFTGSKCGSRSQGEKTSTRFWAENYSPRSPVKAFTGVDEVVEGADGFGDWGHVVGAVGKDLSERSKWMG